MKHSNIMSSKFKSCKNYLRCNAILMIRSGHNFAHATWHVKNFDLQVFSLIKLVKDSVLNVLSCPLVHCLRTQFCCIKTNCPSACRHFSFGSMHFTNPTDLIIIFTFETNTYFYKIWTMISLNTLWNGSLFLPTISSSWSDNSSGLIRPLGFSNLTLILRTRSFINSLAPGRFSSTFR